jgi:hypothetical protein
VIEERWADDPSSIEPPNFDQKQLAATIDTLRAGLAIKENTLASSVAT